MCEFCVCVCVCCVYYVSVLCVLCVLCIVCVVCMCVCVCEWYVRMVCLLATDQANGGGHVQFTISQSTKFCIQRVALHRFLFHTANMCVFVFVFVQSV